MNNITEYQEAIRFVPFDYCHLNDFMKLFRNVFPVSFSRRKFFEIYKWKFENNPYGQNPILVATDRGKAVGFYGTIPLLLQVGDREEIWNLTCISVMQKEYRLQGLFHELFMFHRVKFSENAAAPMVYGYPNSERLASLYTAYYGSHELFRVNCYERELTNLKNRLFKKLPRIFAWGSRVLYDTWQSFWHTDGLTDGTLRIIPNDRLPEDYEKYFKECQRSYFYTVYRSRAYLEWLIFRNPYLELKFYEIRDGERLVGYVVLRLAFTTCEIFDFFCFRDERLQESALKLVESLVRRRPETRKLRVSIHDEVLEKLLEEAGYSVYKQIPCVDYHIRNELSEEDWSRLAAPNQWYVTGAELELG